MKIWSLYSSVIDLNNTTEELFNENTHDKEEDEVRKSVLLSIIIATEIMWKKDAQIIQITEYSEYRQKGLSNDLKEIEQIHPPEKENPAGNKGYDDNAD